jgi:hypothetical protein
MDALEKVVLACFALEVIIKVIAEGVHPENYFKDAWNSFDFAITFLSFIVVLFFKSII